MKVLIDNGHGENTPGKRSPDGRLREWAYTREIADRVVLGLRKKGIDAERIVKEDSDVPLSERCRRVNAIYKETGKKAILVSIHCNAAGNGSNWMNAKGWSVYVSNNASGNSKKLAECLSETVLSIGIPVRKPSPDKLYWQQNLAMCRDTYNPQIQISAESETKRSIFRKRDKTKRSKKESAQHSKSRNKSFVMTSVSAL